MSIALGLNSLTDIKFGNNQVSSVYLGTNLVWSSYSYILDLYSSAHHAYSLRKLRSAYGGFCLRVRRTAITSTEVNVSFDSNNTISLNSPITYASGTATTATTLGQFAAIEGYGTADIGVTANQNIFVVTWYDQSGNDKNPTQGTAGNQPRLVSSTTADLERSGGKVAVRFVRASNTRLTIADTTANISNMSSYVVSAFLTTGTTQNVYALSATNRFYLPTIIGGAIYAGYAGDASSILLNTLTLDRKLYELLAPAPGSVSTIEAWSNGVSKGTAALSSGAISNIWLGHAVSLNHYDGHIQEIIGWQSNTNRLEKETNINSYWTIY